MDGCYFSITSNDPFIKYMNERIGNDKTLGLALVSILNEDSRFNALSKGITDVEVKFEMLKDYYYFLRPDGNNSVSDDYNNIVDKGRFESVAYYTHAVNKTVDLLSESYRDSIMKLDDNGKSKSKGKTRDDYIRDTQIKIFNAARARAASNKQVADLAKANRNNKLSIHDSIALALLDSINATDRYWGALLYEVDHNTQKFFDKVSNNPKLQFLSKELSAETVVEIVEEQEAEEGDNVEFEFESISDAESFDNTLSDLNSHGGFYDNAMKHVDSFVRAYLNSLKRLHSAEKDATGKYIENTDNISGTSDTMNAEECIDMLYHRADTQSPDKFVQSIRNIAKQQAGFEAFAMLADDLETNSDLKYYMCTVFRKELVSKNIIVYEDGKFVSTVSNKNTNKRVAFWNELVDSAKHTSLNVMAEAMGKKLKNIKLLYSNEGASKKNKNDESYITTLASLEKIKEEIPRATGEVLENKKKKLDNITKRINYLQDTIASEIYDILHAYFPTITRDAVNGFLYNTSDGNNFLSNVKSIIPSLDTLIKKANIVNYDKYTIDYKISNINAKLWRARHSETSMYDSEEDTGLSKEEMNKLEDELKTLRRTDYVKPIEPVCATIASQLLRFSNISSELNSPNVHGNLSSDVMNSNYMTYWMHVLNSQAEELSRTDTNNALRNFGKYRFRSHQYDFSNILFERKVGNTTMPGLFKKLEDGSVIPTNYAPDLISFELFNGASNEESGDAATYTEISHNDYIASAFVNFYNPDINVRKNIPVPLANYFVRTQSDAPKTFLVKTPMYSIGRFGEKGSLLTIANKQELVKLNAELLGRIKSETIERQDFNKKHKAVSVEQAAYHLTNDTAQDIKLSDAGKTPAFVKPTKINEEGLVRLMYTDDKGNKFVYYAKGTHIVKGDNGAHYLTNVTFDHAENIGAMPQSLSNQIYEYRLRQFTRDNKVKYAINPNHVLFQAFRNAFIQELTDMGQQIVNLFQLNEDGTIVLDGNKPVLKAEYEGSGINRTYDLYHHNKDRYEEITGQKGDGIIAFGKDKKWHLTGNVFRSDRFRLYKDIDFRTAVVRDYGTELFEDGTFDIIYGKDVNGLKIITHKEGDTVVFDRIDFTEEQSNKIDEKLAEFITDYIADVNRRIGNVERVLQEGLAYLANTRNYIEFALNYHNMYLNMNEILEGDSKFYKDGQDFLKRAKEGQAGGVPYGIANFDEDLTMKAESLPSSLDNANVTVTYHDKNNKLVRSEPIKLSSRFNAITIKNTIRMSEDAKALKQVLVNKRIMDEAGAEEYIKWFDRTKTNDAQSYITFAEWIRRVTAMGQYNKYRFIIDKISKGERLNNDEVDEFVQVQKNFYYDQYYNKEFGLVVPRQIKNAEFVLIPQFIEGTSLEKVYDFMMQNGIDQLNTQETSKAGKANVFTIWDNNGEISDWDGFLKEFSQAPNAIEEFSYNFLYRQQETPQHVDADNKAGIQIMKKIIDNLPSVDDIGLLEQEGETDERVLYNMRKLARLKESFFRLYTSNIKGSFTRFGRILQIGYDEKGNIRVDENGNITFDKELLYKKLRDEARRLGLNSNEIEYMELDEFGQTKMPSHFTIFSNKLENIVQSLINRSITRQTLPGFHAAQVTGIGITEKWIGKNGDIKTAKEWKGNKLRYHPDGKPYIEVVVPRPKYLDKFTDEEIFKVGNDGKNMLERLGIDTFMMYRIPTEGKQSIAIGKIVGFVDKVQGSTIIVPDDWVAQTGADFDIDSIYAIQAETYVDRKGNVHIVNYSTGTREIDYINRYAQYVREAYKDFKEVYKNTERDLNKKARAKVIEGINQIGISEKQEIETMFSIGTENGTESELYHNVIQSNREEKATIDGILRDNSITFYDRVKKLVDTYADDVKKNPDSDLAKFIAFYDELLDTMSVFENERSNIFEFFSDEQREIRNNIELNALKQAAEKLGLINYENFKELPIEEQNIKKARNNEILRTMIEIASNDLVLEEILSQSNFRDIIAARDEMANKKEKVARKARSPYNFFDQADYQEEVMSGAMLKALSVSRDTFCSICNTVRPTLALGFDAIYSADKFDINKLNKSYDKVEEFYVDGKKYYKVHHNKLGWSKDNRGVSRKHITIYTSQTTAHHLDAVKEGGVRNVNTLTFGVYKTFPDMGSDYRTAIGFITQPGISRIINAYDRSRSIFNKDYNRVYIDTAIKSLAMNMKLKVNNATMTDFYVSINDVLNAFENEYGDYIRQYILSSTGMLDEDINNFKIGYDISNIGKIGFNADLYKNRLYNEGIFGNTPVEGSDAKTNRDLFDLIVMLQYYRMSEIAENINNYARVASPDKFGAKQTIFSTQKIFDDIDNLISNKNGHFMYVSDELGNKKNMLESIYPDLKNNGHVDIEHYARSTNNESSYPSLHYFLKYASATSILLGRQIFDTQQAKFRDGIYRIADELGVSINEKLYNDFKQYVFGHLMTVGTTRYEDAYIHHILGVGQSLFINFEPENISKPNEDEKDLFRSMTPAQKVIWIQQHFSDGLIFNYLRVNVYNNRRNKNKLSPQRISFNYDTINIESAFDEFRKAYYNDNFYLRNAAESLVEYALIAENFKMRRNGVSKIVTNDVLREMEIPEMIQINKIETLDALFNPGQEANTVYTDYIRSHKEKVRRYRIPKGEDNKDMFKIEREDRVLSVLPLGSINDSESLGYKAGLIDENGNYDSYLRFIWGNNNNRQDVLMKAYIDEETGMLYYYPLNELMESEHTIFSADQDNNKYYTEETYIIKCKELSHGIRDQIKRTEQNFYQKKKNPKIEEIFDINEPDDNVRSSFNKVVTEVMEHFSTGVENALFIRSAALAGKGNNDRRFIALDSNGSVQQIGGRRYIIIPVSPNKTKPIVKNELKGKTLDYFIKHPDRLEGLNESFKNIVESVANSDKNIGKNEIFMVIPYREIERLSTVSEYANETLTTIEDDRNRGSLRAANTISSLRAFDIDRKNEESVNKNLKRTTGAIRRYVVGNSNAFLRRIDDFFETHDENAVSIDSAEVMNAIKENQSIRNDFLKFVLDVDNFVGNYKNIYELNVKSDNVDINYNIEKIKEAVSKLENNSSISRAKELFIKDYLSSISTDPLIKADLFELTDGYNNVSGLESWISDAIEAGIPLMQVVLKDVMADVEGKTMEGKKVARDFMKEIKTLESEAASAGKKIDYNKIIDATGHFVRSYTPKLVEERDRRLKELEEIRNDPDRGPLSADYIKARHNYNVWKSEHFELPYVKEYYDRKYANEATILDTYPEYYAQYVKLEDQRHTLYMEADDGELNERDKETMAELTAKINAMRSETVDEDGFIPKSAEELAKVNALNNFLQGEKNIQNEFFQPAATKGMQEKINDNLRIMRAYERRDANGIPTVPDSELARIPEYVKASQWIRLNATLEFTDKELEARIQQAYKTLREDTEETTAKKTSKYGAYIRKANARDSYGIVDGRLFDETQIQKIKEDQEAKYRLTNPNRLLRYSTGDGIIYKDSFYRKMTRGASAKTETADWTRIVKEINEILQTVYENDKNTLHTSRLTKDQLYRLATLYNELNDKSVRHYSRSKATGARIREFISENVDFETDWNVFNTEETLARSKGAEYFDAWRLANTLETIDEDSNKKVRMPNGFLYSYAKPKGNIEITRDTEGNITDIKGDSKAMKYVDIDRTKAIDTIRNNVRTVTTEYYGKILAEKQKLPQAEYKKWYDANHIYNPNTRRVEPIKCWLRTEYVNSALEAGKTGMADSKYEWVPNHRQITKYIKPEYDNKANRKSGGDLNNYKVGTGYDNEAAKSLTQYEIRMRDEMQSILDNYLNDAGYKGKKLYDSGRLPTLANAVRDSKWFAKQFGATVGLLDTREQQDFYEEIDYDHDVPTDIPMMQQLINKQSRKLLFAKSRDEFPNTPEGEAEYRKHLKEVKEDNDKIKKDNEAIHEQIMNRNWKEVFSQFIPRMARYNAIQQNKYMLYFGLNTLKRMRAYDSPLGFRWNPRSKVTAETQGAPVGPIGYSKDYKNSTKQTTRYKTTSYDNAVELYKTYIRRLLFNQHKRNNGAFTTIGNTLQNMSSAKFMMANITGGIVNVTYGESQVLQEIIAKEFIGASSWKEGRKLYSKAIGSYFHDMFTNESSTLQNALIKLFNVIDTDTIIGVADTGVEEAVKKSRDFLYGLQSGGEHLMQNTVLLGMMKSHKVIRQPNGSIKIQTLEQYQRDTDELALNYIIKEKYPELSKVYDAFINEIESNPNKTKDYVTRHRFLITDFFELLNDTRRKQIAEDYIAKRKEINKLRESEWNAEKDLYSQFVLEDGYAELDKNSVFNEIDKHEAWKLLGEFRNKVVYVNKKIHGVYDQMGAARLEQEWYGSLVMQYHKHIYPGLMKRYRWQGYYNETRESVEKGSFTSLIDFLRIPMANAAKALNMTKEQYQTMSGIQKMFKVITDGCLNYQLHWKLLPESERANFRRNFTDWIMFVNAVAVAGMIRVVWKNEKDRDSMTFNTLAYAADKTGMDLHMYMPWGLVNETKTIWKSPIAAQSSIEDLLNSMGLIGRYLMDDEASLTYTSGVNKGKSKLQVWTLRQIPVYRGINRWLSLPKNNRAYALQTNMGREMAKYFASFFDGTVEAQNYQ